MQAKCQMELSYPNSRHRSRATSASTTASSKPRLARSRAVAGVAPRRSTTRAARFGVRRLYPGTPEVEPDRSVALTSFREHACPLAREARVVEEADPPQLLERVVSVGTRDARAQEPLT